MRVFPTDTDPPLPKKRTAALRIRRGDGRREVIRKIKAGTYSDKKNLSQEVAHPYHVGHPNRRRKTPAELIAGHEFIELYDRANPGRLARGGAL